MEYKNLKLMQQLLRKSVNVPDLIYLTRKNKPALMMLSMS